GKPRIMTEKLDQLKAHSAFPFARFREDEAEYMMLELYWLEVFKTALGDVADDYEAWLSPASMHDGNPIFSALRADLERGVVIKAKWMEEGKRHYRDAGTSFPFQPYIADYAINVATRTPRAPALVFLADLSAEAEALAVDFLRALCVERVS